ncbi:hypothetical protein KIW84_011901 [Lathyrus oleraceus]|uniref:Pentatricopeptide repeat-containing protein n=1 Tax=Pisum sativum TaxID=3888 RepID=A0A9D5GVE8_PEA|nr:hypothetical protein KIW84_011901 [Pisum sativum]
MSGKAMPNSVTVATLLPVCARSGNLNAGKSVHGYVIKSGFEEDAFAVCASFDDIAAYCSGRKIHSYVLQWPKLSGDISVCNALMSFYLKIRRTKEAESLFWAMNARDLVSWKAIIAGYASNGEWLKALYLFGNLASLETLLLDSVTMVSILPACAQLEILLVGKQVHAYIFRHPFLFEDASVGNVLVSFYAKCGYIEEAYHAFSMISRKDLISWNSILDAFGEKRHHSRFISLLHLMLKIGIRPDYVTILTIIHFCASLLRVEKVKEIHGYSIRTESLFSATAPTVGNAILDAYSKTRIGNAFASGTVQSASLKNFPESKNSVLQQQCHYLGISLSQASPTPAFASEFPTKEFAHGISLAAESSNSTHIAAASTSSHLEVHGSSNS